MWGCIFKDGLLKFMCFSKTGWSESKKYLSSSQWLLNIPSKWYKLWIANLCIYKNHTHAKINLQHKWKTNQAIHRKTKKGTSSILWIPFLWEFRCIEWPIGKKKQNTTLATGVPADVCTSICSPYKWKSVFEDSRWPVWFIGSFWRGQVTA